MCSEDSLSPEAVDKTIEVALNPKSIIPENMPTWFIKSIK